MVCVGLAAVVVAAGLTAASSRADESRRRRAFQLTYDVRWEPVPADARQIRVWIPLAASDRYQKIRRRRIRCSVPYRITQDPQYGNDILYLTLREPLPKALDLSIRYDAVVRGDDILRSLPATEPGNPPAGGWAKEVPGARQGERPPDPEIKEGELLLNLQSNRYMVINEEIKQLAQAVTAGAQTPTRKAQAIYRYVIERMTYEKQTPGWGVGDTARACEVGAGNCTDFHSLFISLARASDIPARFKIGLPLAQKPQGDIPGYHCWAEFFLEGAGWVPVDASEAWKDREKQDYFFGTYDPNRLTVSNGRDIPLDPPSVEGPVNIFFFPLVEVDGKLQGREYISTRFHYRDLKA